MFKLAQIQTWRLAFLVSSAGSTVNREGKINRQIRWCQTHKILNLYFLAEHFPLEYIFHQNNFIDIYQRNIFENWNIEHHPTNQPIPPMACQCPQSVSVSVSVSVFTKWPEWIPMFWNDNMSYNNSKVFTSSSQLNTGYILFTIQFSESESLTSRGALAAVCQDVQAHSPHVVMMNWVEFQDWFVFICFQRVKTLTSGGALAAVCQDVQAHAQQCCLQSQSGKQGAGN